MIFWHLVYSSLFSTKLRSFSSTCEDIWTFWSLAVFLISLDMYLFSAASEAPVFYLDTSPTWWSWVLPSLQISLVPWSNDLILLLKGGITFLTRWPFIILHFDLFPLYSFFVIILIINQSWQKSSFSNAGLQNGKSKLFVIFWIVWWKSTRNWVVLRR